MELFWLWIIKFVPVVLWTSDPNIVFSDGVCAASGRAIKNRIFVFAYRRTNPALERIVNEIKVKGRDKPYDCIIGLRGVDSSYVALSKELGLRPLAVHLDNGWNSKLQ